jgi:rare lipoprotein A
VIRGQRRFGSNRRDAIRPRLSAARRPARLRSRFDRPARPGVAVEVEMVERRTDRRATTRQNGLGMRRWVLAALLGTAAAGCATHSLQAPATQHGVASWYGPGFHGQATASGETYDQNAMTAAHRSWPLGTRAQVTNLDNGRSVTVRINDRGPFVDGRIIDLSYTAAHKLGVLAGGSALVEVEAVLPGSSPPPAQVAAVQPQPEPVVPAAAPAPVIVLPPAQAAVDAAGYYVQIGAFGSRDNAENFLARVQAQLGATDNLHVYSRDQLHRVHAGPYSSQAAARQAAERIGEALAIKPMVLTR